MHWIYIYFSEGRLLLLMYKWKDNNNYDAHAARRVRQQASASSSYDDELSTVGSILGATFCFVLFLVILASIAYPLTMYRESPVGSHVYADDKWWCYHCYNCAARCW
jgi:hypothetical protein